MVDIRIKAVSQPRQDTWRAPFALCRSSQGVERIKTHRAHFIEDDCGVLCTSNFQLYSNSTFLFDWTEGLLAGLLGWAEVVNLHPHYGARQAENQQDGRAHLE